MKEKNNKEYQTLLIFNVLVFVFFTGLFLLGSFTDESIAASLYTPNSLVAKIITSCGVYPFFAFAVLFTGVLCERIIHSGLPKPVKIILAAFAYLIATFVGFIGAGALVDGDCLGSLFPALNRNIPVIVGLCFVTNPPLLCLGFYLGAKKKDDDRLIKSVICLLVLLGITYGTMEILKGVFHRPRYRLVVQGIEGIGYIPWYTPFHRAKEFIESLGIPKGEFRSFPSGHAILSMSMVFILQSLSFLSGKLKNKKLILGIAGLIFSVIIMSTRMILGAHYLSDVCAGAVVSTVFALIYTVIQHQINNGRKPNGTT